MVQGKAKQDRRTDRQTKVKAPTWRFAFFFVTKNAKVDRLIKHFRVATNLVIFVQFLIISPRFTKMFFRYSEANFCHFMKLSVKLLEFNCNNKTKLLLIQDEKSQDIQNKW